MSQKKGLLSFLPPPKPIDTTSNFVKTTSSSTSTSTTTTTTSNSTAAIVKPSSSSAKPIVSNAVSKAPIQAQNTKIEAALPATKKVCTEEKREPVNYLIGISNYYDSDSDDSEDLSEVKPLDVDDDYVTQKRVINSAPQSNLPVPKATHVQQSVQFQEDEDQCQDGDYDDEEQDTPSTSLSAVEEIMKMQGGKRKRNEPVDIVDVNVGDIIKANKEQLLKNMTKEELKPTRTFTPGAGRKKSQITYLAMMAKEREQELKNTWAESKFTKKMGRQKYGF